MRMEMTTTDLAAVALRMKTTRMVKTAALGFRVSKLVLCLILSYGGGRCSSTGFRVWVGSENWKDSGTCGLSKQRIQLLHIDCVWEQGDSHGVDDLGQVHGVIALNRNGDDGGDYTDLNWMAVQRVRSGCVHGVLCGYARWLCSEIGGAVVVLVFSFLHNGSATVCSGCAMQWLCYAVAVLRDWWLRSAVNLWMCSEIGD